MGKCRDYLNTVTFECDWKDMGLMGLCAGSLGALVGMVVPEKYKNAAAFGAGAGFFLSAVAVTVKSIEASRNDDDIHDLYETEEWEDWDDEDDEEGFVMKITTEENVEE